jgi:hypothetical protein
MTAASVRLRRLDASGGGRVLVQVAQVAAVGEHGARPTTCALLHKAETPHISAAVGGGSSWRSMLVGHPPARGGPGRVGAAGRLPTPIEARRRSRRRRQPSPARGLGPFNARAGGASGVVWAAWNAASRDDDGGAFAWGSRFVSKAGRSCHGVVHLRAELSCRIISSDCRQPDSHVNLPVLEPFPRERALARASRTPGNLRYDARSVEAIHRQLGGNVG